MVSSCGHSRRWHFRGCNRKDTPTTWFRDTQAQPPSTKSQRFLVKLSFPRLDYLVDWLFGVPGWGTPHKSQGSNPSPSSLFGWRKTGASANFKGFNMIMAHSLPDPPSWWFGLCAFPILASNELGCNNPQIANPNHQWRIT